MNFLEWDKELESGIDLLDNQHKKIFKVANNFMIKYQFKMNEEACKDFIDFLEQYVLYHFQTEEAFQRESEYPKTNSHHAMHDIFKIQLTTIILKLEASNYDQTTVDEFYRFLITACQEHILIEDLDFCRFYKSYKIASSF